MNKKEKHIAIAGFVFSGFLFLCAVINFVTWQIGAAISSLGSGIFFWLVSLSSYEKVIKAK